MAELAQLIIAVVVTNAGGVGKTHVAEILECLARLTGRRTQVIDADPGNRGYRNRNGQANAVLLEWATGTEDDPVTWYEKHVTGREMIIFDLGANFLSADRPVSRFLEHVVLIGLGRSARVVFLPIDVPNKPGSTGLVEQLNHTLRGKVDVILVQNDIDRSGAFAPTLSLLGPPVLRIGHLARGYEAVRLRRELRLDEVIRNPEEDYALATAAIADRLLHIARDPAITGLLGNLMQPDLASLAAGKPGPLTWVVNDLKAAADDALRANARLRQAHKALLAPEISNEELLRAANEYRIADYILRNARK